ncbi:MAG: methyltransferase domain-containing protein [Deltaproteobacteria bacterium]|nr:methyltransferase domain-containing protein [Deltaproteobacteria bacterium]
MHDHKHDHAHGEHRFRFSQVAKLDGPERMEFQNPAVLIEHLAAGGTPARILDVGAGTGTFALPLLERFGEARLAALDVEPRMLGVLYGRAMERGLAGRLELLEVPSEDPAAFPEVEAPFALVLMMNLHHEIDDRPRFLASVKAVCAPGARIVICDWSPDAVIERGPPREIRATAGTLLAELEAAGFTGGETLDLYPDFNTVVARAP